MLRLTLFRHAKSSWRDPDLDDFDRPLNKRGREAAPRMAAFMRKQELAPDLVLCSSAVRTRQTWDLLAPAFPDDTTVRFEKRLYLATSDILLARLRRLPKDVRHVLLIGHNPGLHFLALELAGRGAPDDLEALATKFPTCALAVIDVDMPRWDELSEGVGRLVLFQTPRRLP